MQGLVKMEWLGTEALEAGGEGPDWTGGWLAESLHRFGWIPSEPALVEMKPGGRCVVLDGSKRVHMLAALNKANGRSEPMQVPCAILDGKAAAAAAIARSFGSRAIPWEQRTGRIQEYLKGEADESDGIKGLSALVGTQRQGIANAVQARRWVEEGSASAELEGRMKRCWRMGRAVAYTPGTWRWWLAVGAETEGGNGPKDETERSERLRLLLDTVFGKDPELSAKELERLGSFIEAGGKMADVQRMGGLKAAEDALEPPEVKARRAAYAMQEQGYALHIAMEETADYDALVECAGVLGNAYRDMRYAWNALGRKLAAEAPEPGDGEEKPDGIR